MENKEIEVRFLEVRKDDLVEKLVGMGAEDLGEDHLEEIIFYDPGLTWPKMNKMVRLRKTRGSVFLTYKYHEFETVDGTHEIELTVSDMEQATKFLEAIGLTAFRRQEKKRHTLKKDGVTIDIDSWPKIPPYAEFEGPDEQSLRSITEKLGLDWSKAEFASAKEVISRHYGIPVTDLRWYTFDRIE
jgi:adenylate cyclase, class 2